MEAKPYSLHTAYIYLLIAGLCLGGCAPSATVLRGEYSLPTEYNVSWSPDRNIEARWCFVGWYPGESSKDDASKADEYPTYLTDGRLNILSNKIKGVVANLEISNPSRKKFQILKVVTIGRHSQEIPLGGWTDQESLNLSPLNLGMMWVCSDGSRLARVM